MSLTPRKLALLMAFLAGVQFAAVTPAAAQAIITNGTVTLGGKTGLTFQAGDGRCVFLVHLDEPIDEDNWEFKLESEMTSQ